jgi:hypothetical protein
LQVPDAVKAAGFLSPRPGNDFTFHPVSAKFPGDQYSTMILKALAVQLESTD